MIAQREKEMKEAIEFLVSCTSKEEIKEFVRMVQSQHPTHQQSLGRLIYALLLAWDKDYREDNFDARNRETLGFAYDAIQSVGECYFPFI